jgi:type IV fimbrial biogenesis protein FimT
LDFVSFAGTYDGGRGMRRAHLRLLGAARHTPDRHFNLRSRLRRAAGFTTTELMVALAIVVVLAAIGTPSLLGIIASQRVKTATFDLYASLNLARSEAIKRNAVVTITPRGGDFANGYDLQVGGITLKSESPLTSVAIVAPAGVPLAFDGYGRLSTPVRYQLELSAAGNPSISKRCLIINMSGKPSIRADNDHDGNCING